MRMISLGELVVEFFRCETDVPFSKPGLIEGPFASGAPAITTDTFAKLGGNAGFIGTVGNDDFATCILNRLKNDNVDIDKIIKLQDYTTGCAFTSYFSDGSRRFLYYMKNEAPAAFSAEHIDEDYIKNSDWLHISGNVLGFSDSAKKAIFKAVDIAYENSVPISLDPNMRLEIMEKEEITKLLQPVLDKTTVFFPSEGEISCVSGLPEEEGLCTLLEYIPMIVKKEGKRGCTVYTEKEYIHIDTYIDTEVVDPTGCGDSFDAGFIYARLQGWTPAQSALFANAVGSITATKRGAMEGVESLNQVLDFMKNGKTPNVEKRQR